MGVEECKPIELPVAADPQGNLAFAEGGAHVPFPIARVFHVYGIPTGAARGGHSHLTLEQAVFCVSGALEIAVDDGEQRRTFALDDPRQGLYLPPLVWHDIGGFAPGTVYLVLASAEFDERDYIRDRDEFLRTVRAARADAPNPT
ncbi:MAG TPA: FdtA/QdtA family cupin domain-containing protein [Solirubrobacterales bacterium]